MNVETIETMSHLVKSTEKSTSPTEGRNLSCRKKKNKKQSEIEGECVRERSGVGMGGKTFL